MIKNISLLALLLGFCLLGAVEVVVENYDSGVDIWLLLPYDSFIFGAGDAVAEYQLSTQIKDGRGKQAAVNETQLAIPRYSWLQGTAVPLLQQYDLGPGNYELNLSLRNRKLGDRRNFSRQFRVGTQKTEIGQAYVLATREGFRYIPGILDLRELESLILRQSFSIAARRISLQLDEQRVDISYPQSPWEQEIISIAQSDSLAELSLSITEDNIRYEMEALLYKPWFSFNARYSAKDQLAQIRYIATQNEWQILRKVPDSKLAEAIESYWQAHDPTPGTLRNENREQFYSRVLRADELFTIHRRLTGWKSDRGRIYIKFGEPEQIVNNAFPIGEPPSIRWHYFRLNLSFLFTDDRGFGQYNLRNKDEEYQDF
jgi:GWxTD domain-containing protein